MHVDVSDVRVRYSCSLIEVSVRVMMSESALVWRAYCLQESTTTMRLIRLWSTPLFRLRSQKLPDDPLDVSRQSITRSGSPIHTTTHDFSASRRRLVLSPSTSSFIRSLSHSATHTHTPAQLRTQHTAHDSPVSSPQPAASAAPMPAPCSRRAAARPPPASHVNYSVQPATRRSHARRRCDARGGAVPRVPGRRPVRVVVETRAEVREVPLAMRLPP